MNKIRTALFSGKLLLIMLMAAGILLLAGCSSGEEKSATTEPESEAGQDSAATTTEEASSAQPEGQTSDAPAGEVTQADDLYAGVAEMTDGTELFTLLCTKCHGMEGKGDGPSSGSLHAQINMDLTATAARSDEELMTTITQGKGVDMPAWGLMLTVEQREALIAHIRTLYN